ncbi:OsmC family protein [Lentzea aerocolonigenes]|uniref:OsmC family protein n=1 Tax=Lentzea aerocolonigenes TaxID=68170 RepID=UPI0004C3EE82|nr:OsmC family protein [Lentzea aerocolonigenes]MCP2247121.1 putative OsmC-related protein [Lentzea aerocolonigenes]
MIEIERVGDHEFVASNERGATVRIGRKGQEGSFSPVELLVAAAAGCAVVTSETLILRRTGGEQLSAVADAVQSESGNEVISIPVTLSYDLSSVDDPEALETVVRRAVEQFCTVTRTLKQSATAPLQLPMPLQTAEDPL